MENESKVWYRNYSCAIKSAPDDIIRIESIIATIQNERNMSRSEAVLTMFLAGVEILSQNPLFMSAESSTDKAIAEQVQRVSANKQNSNRLIYLLREMGEAAFVAWAQENDIDYSATIAEAADQSADTFCRTKSSYSFRADQFLANFLEQNGPTKVDEIFAAAEIAGILPDPKISDQSIKKNFLRTIASNRGYSSCEHRGVWQIP